MESVFVDNLDTEQAELSLLEYFQTFSDPRTKSANFSSQAEKMLLQSAGVFEYG